MSPRHSPTGCKRAHLLVGGLALLALICSLGCRGKATAGTAQVMLRVEGSDTMVNIAQAWAERYHQRRGDVSVQVLGGGSGVGVASLIEGRCDMANSSRKMKPDEIRQVTEQRGKPPVEHVVGYDALAIFVHRDNPLESIAIDQLAEIYGEGGNVNKWAQLGVADGPFCGRIIRVNRQNSSGTYSYFREVVLGKHRDFALGSVDANGSKDAVALISHTPKAIGYSGMGYRAPGAKMLPVSKKQGEPAVAPTVENARARRYPITRPLLIYTVGEPSGPLRDYLDWIVSPAGQEVVMALGYVPVR